MQVVLFFVLFWGVFQCGLIKTYKKSMVTRDYLDIKERDFIVNVEIQGELENGVMPESFL